MKFSEVSLAVFLTLIPSLYGVIPGGLEEIPVDSPEVVRLSQVALLKLNEGKVGSSQKNLVEIVKASRQIVSGTLTRLTLKLSEGEEKTTCEVKIWEQPWLNKTEVTFSECGGQKRKRDADLQEKEAKQEALHGLFTSFISKFNKVYPDEKEYMRRFRIFRANLKKIQLLRETEQGTAQYGLTHFADMTVNEFKKYLGYKKSEDKEELPVADIPDIVLPPEFDWRSYNVVTPVKNQFSCGSCWAFSVTGNVEGQWALKKGKLISLSEQELVDCDRKDHGCSGGEMTDAYKSIMKLGGLEQENDYPYEGVDESCKFDKSEVAAKISGAVQIPKNETDMAMWMVKNGPISVALNANAMMFYFGGISHPRKFLCDPDNLNHGVLIVGYGVHTSRFTRKTLPYWIIKNSWGLRFGERGYYRLYRGDNSCGINADASSALVN